jgi:hypothetical protein
MLPRKINCTSILMSKCVTGLGQIFDVIKLIFDFCDLKTKASLRQCNKYYYSKLNLSIDGVELDKIKTEIAYFTSPSGDDCICGSECSGMWCISTLIRCKECRCYILCAYADDSQHLSDTCDFTPTFECRSCKRIYLVCTKCLYCVKSVGNTVNRKNARTFLCKLVAHCPIDNFGVEWKNYSEPALRSEDWVDANIPAHPNQFYYDHKQWSITGPDGGFGSHWLCVVCNTEYHVNDK